MKITDFSELWKAVNKIKINVIAKTEIGLFENEGIDTDLSDVYTSSKGELFTVLKDGSIRKTIVHICDISRSREEWDLPKFHIFECDTLESMRRNDRGHRYKKASRTDGQFWMIKATGGEFDALTLCSHCKKQYNVIYSGNISVNNFNIADYIEKPIQHLELITSKIDMTTIPRSYASNWSDISKERKEYCRWICQECFYDLSSHQKYLHTHHINADISNNGYENLKVLCIKCHAKEFQHGRIKQTREYNDFLQLKENYAS